MGAALQRYNHKDDTEQAKNKYNPGPRAYLSSPTCLHANLLHLLLWQLTRDLDDYIANYTVHAVTATSKLDFQSDVSNTIAKGTLELCAVLCASLSTQVEIIVWYHLQSAPD